MVTKTFKLSNKNQATIPKSSRKVLNVKAHDRIRFTNDYKNHVVIISKVTKKHHNMFDNPEFNRKNYVKFMHACNLNTGQTRPRGKEI